MLNAVDAILLLFRAYMMLVFVWVLGSWFPQWRYQSWFRTIDGIVRPYVDLFKFLPLQIGMVDLRPMAAIFLLVILMRMMESVAGGL